MKKITVFVVISIGKNGGSVCSSVWSDLIQAQRMVDNMSIYFNSEIQEKELYLTLEVK